MPPTIGRSALKLLTRRFPLYSGQYRASHFPLARRLTAADELVWTRLRDGSWILVNVGDMIGRTIFYCADHDPKISWLCRRILRPGDCCLDVGAHVGAVALQAARLVGPGGVVHAFEPQPVLASMLRRSAERNGYGQLRLHAVALSDRDGELPLFVPGGNTGLATFDPEFSVGREALRVPLRNAGAALAELDPPPVRLLKLDIEHHEAEFFAGAAGFLRARGPDAVLFESHDRGLGFWERPAVAALTELGYDLFQVPKSLAAPRLIPLRPPSPPPSAWWDFVALSRRAVAAGALPRLGASER